MKLKQRFKEKFFAFKKKNKYRNAIVISGAVLIVLIVFALNAFSQGNNGANFQLATVRRGSIVSSVSGIGQVLPSRQLDLRPGATARVSSIPVANNDKVKAGQLILQLDSKDIQRTIRDSETALKNASLAYKNAVTQNKISLSQASSSISQAKGVKKTSESTLAKASQDAYSAVSSSVADINGALQTLSSLQKSGSLSSSDLDQTNRFMGHFIDARNKDSVLQVNFASSTRNDGEIETLIDYASDTLSSASMALKDAYDILNTKASNLPSDSQQNQNDLVQQFVSLMQGQSSSSNSTQQNQSSVSSYEAKINNDLSQILTAKQNIYDAQGAISNADMTVRDKNQVKDSLREDTNPTIEAQGLNLTQKSDAYNDALQNLRDYEIRASFDGSIVKLNANVGDLISPSNPVATLISDNDVATISLNEIDAAKVYPGQKVNITFDALPNLTFTGKVSNVDKAGTLNQGVVTYGVRADFDVEDDRIKPGMTVNADIVTDHKQDTLFVPNSALQNQGNAYYVQVMSSAEKKGTPIQKAVTIGLSNDEYTEVTSGLSEGDVVVINPQK
jgi:HlyD family secretion protein